MKLKYERGLCSWHGCQEAGTIEPKTTQRFCQGHWDMLEGDRKHHEDVLQEIRAWGIQRRAALAAASQGHHPSEEEKGA